MLNLRTSNSRLPADHFISGALFGGITAGALEYVNQSESKSVAKRVLKYSLEGGIATSLAISASNKIVQKNYLNATFDVALGVGLIVAVEKILN